MVIFRALGPSPDNRSTSFAGVIGVETGPATIAETGWLPGSATATLQEPVWEL